MNLREELLKEHSKAQAIFIAKYIGNDSEKFAQLIELFLHDEYRVNQRAAWVVRGCFQNHPELVTPYVSPMIHNLAVPGIHDAVKRNTLKILELFDFPQEDLGILADLCFTFLADPKEPVAIKVGAMNILYRLCQEIPELSDELIILIEDQLPYQTAGFKNRGKKILKWLRA